MSYSLTIPELKKLSDCLQVVMAVPFIDDVEDYILEAIWEYVKDIDGPDPFYNIRSKRLYDVVDNNRKISWSVKSLQWPFRPNGEFELVIQRADVYKKAVSLGFPHLDSNSDPSDIGTALLRHWQLKVEEDAIAQGVKSKRIMILLKTVDKRQFAVVEDDILLYLPEELNWQWTNSSKNGLQAIRRSDGKCVYRWYPSQKQFFERFTLPESLQLIHVTPKRLKKAQVVDILLPFLQEQS